MMTTRHFRMSPEEVMGRPSSPATDVYYAAYFLVELVTAAEPFPIDEEFAYMEAVRHGHPELPPGLPVEVTRAFDPDPIARPSLSELEAALRETERARPRRSWWSRWFGR